MFKSVWYSFLAVAFVVVATSFVLVQEDSHSTELLPGVVFEIEVTNHEQSPPQTGEMEVMIEGRNIAMPISSNNRKEGNGKMIFRGDRGEMGEVIAVDDDKKSYYVLDESVFSGIQKQLSEAEKMMQEAMKNLSKEQREAIEKASQQGGLTMPGMAKSRPAPELKNTGERAEKQGYPCVKYEVVQDESRIREIWVTDWDNIDGGEEAAEAFKGMSAFIKALMEAIPPMPGGGDPLGGQNPYDAMNFENGFPVGTLNYDEEGELREESWLRSTRRQRIDPDAFEPPAGYKRMSMGPR